MRRDRWKTKRRRREVGGGRWEVEGGDEDER